MRSPLGRLGGLRLESSEDQFKDVVADRSLFITVSVGFGHELGQFLLFRRREPFIMLLVNEHHSPSILLRRP